MGNGARQALLLIAGKAGQYKEGIITNAFLEGF